MGNMASEMEMNQTIKGLFVTAFFPRCHLQPTQTLMWMERFSRCVPRLIRIVVAIKSISRTKNQNIIETVKSEILI
jgi:hypothetical protein